MNKKTVFCVSITLILASTVFSKELVSDDKTLFLCNLNDKIDADFAKGAEKLGIVGLGEQFLKKMPEKKKGKK